MLLFIILKIFFARIIDVSIGTFRTILTVKGLKVIPSVLAFFEVIIWYYVAKEALLVDINSIFIPISYSLGYATGTFIGAIISGKLMKSKYMIHFNSKDLKEITNILNKKTIDYDVVNNNSIVVYSKTDLYKLLQSVNKKILGKLYYHEVNNYIKKYKLHKM